MWTYLASWVVKDGDAPELRVGDVLRDRVLGASCWTLRESADRDGITEHPTPHPSAGLPGVNVTGTSIWGAGAGEALIRVDSWHVLAQPDGSREVNGPHGIVYQPYAPGFRVPAPETRVTAQGRLRVLPSHEEDDLGLPGLGRDWLVRRIQVEHRELLPDLTGGPSNRTVGDVVGLVEIEQMQRWADDNRRDLATYRLDLEGPLGA